MSSHLSGRIVGALFLAAFVLYGGGSALADRAAGHALVLLNSAAVAAIGALAFASLRAVAARTARAYLAARLAEAVLLAAGAALLAAGNADGNDVLYGAAMVVLGVGSVPFCLALARHRWTPRWLAYWGAAGYVLLAAGSVLEFAVRGAGVVLAVPGGLFEVVLGVLLLVRGFPTVDEPGTPPGVKSDAAVRSGG